MRLPDRVYRDRVIPVARGLDAGSAPGLVAALVSGGIGSIEITVEGDGGVAAIGAVAAEGVVVGAGTVTTVAMADQVAAAGAEFVVSPHFDAELVAWGHDRRIPVVPGSLTPNEIATAWRTSPAAVKLFPAHLGGPGYLRSLLAPYPDLALIPTGGVDADNIADYLRAGAVAVGVGGWLTEGHDYEEVERRAALLISAVSEVESGL